MRMSLKQSKHKDAAGLYLLTTPFASIAYEGINEATMTQSSMAYDALLLHLATSRRIIANVSRAPHAMVVRRTSAVAGLSAIGLTIEGKKS